MLKKVWDNILEFIKIIIKDILTVVPLMIVGMILGYFISMFCFMSSVVNLERENIELRLRNTGLEEQVKMLDYKQAELTKKIAELNGIGG